MIIHATMLRFFINILQILINPTRGWEDISYDSTEVSKLTRRGYFPLIAITALTSFALYYHAAMRVDLIYVIKQTIITFTIFFATYYFAEFMFSTLFEPMSEKTYSSKRNSTLIIYSLSILALMQIVVNIVPFDFMLLYFLPIYAGVIIYKAIPYMGVKEDKIGQYMFLGVFSIIVPVYLLQVMFKVFTQS